MIIQEDNRWKVVILFYKKNGACVFWPRILSFLAGKFDAFEQILLTEPIMKKLYFFLDGKIAIFFLTTLNIILNCPTKSQNIICLSFCPWFWQMSLTRSILAKPHLFFGIDLSLNGIIVFLAASQIFKSQSAKNENSNKSTNTKWIVNLALASSPHDQ